MVVEAQFARNSSSSGGATPPTQPAKAGVDMLVNGKTETAATATTTQEGTKKVTTVTVDDKKVEEKLQQEGNNAVAIILVNNGADVVVGTLNGQTVKNMESKEAVLEVKTENVSYTLPASQINIDSVSEVNKVRAGFTDANSAADYAKAGIATCVKTGIISGRSKTTLAPKDDITHAILSRLLQQSGLI